MTGLRERKKQQTRDAIVRAAGTLFARNGFHTTTMEQIAAAADVSAGTLYNYFGTKQAVLLTHLDTEVQEMVGAGAVVITDPPADLTRAIQSLVSAYADGFLELKRDFLRELFAAGFSPASEVLPELLRLDHLLAEQMAELLRRFDGQLDPAIAAEEAVVAIYSAFAVQLMMYVSAEDMSAATVRRAISRQIEVVCSGLRAPER